MNNYKSNYLYSSLSIFTGLLVILALYLSSLHSYLLFHTLAEFFGIIITCGIFMLAWNARRLLDNDFLLFLGIAYIFVAFLDLLHTFAYKGMGVFYGFSADLPTQLWIAARYLESIALMISPLFLFRKLNSNLLFFFFSVILALLTASIFYWRIFPVCFIEGYGLSNFKQISEYLICFFFLISLLLFLKNRRRFDPQVLNRLVLFSIFNIISELAFTYYLNVYDVVNLVGHLFNIISYYCLYEAIIVIGLGKPFNLLFKSLKDSREALSGQVEKQARINTRLEEEINERKRARSVVDRLNQELQERIHEQEIANQELEAFSYSASHDIRTPLTTIDGFSQLLEKYNAGQLDADGKEYLREIRKAIAHILQLLEALLNLAQVRKLEFNRKSVNLSQLAKNIAKQLQLADQERQVEFLGRENITAQGDPYLLEILLTNLLSNAWKFTRQQPKAIIEFGSKSIEEQTVFFVKDNGVGFEEQEAGKIFSPFTRLHDKSRFPGSGIGLATAYRIVERHNGKIWAESRPDQGATFYFTL